MTATREDWIALLKDHVAVAERLEIDVPNALFSDDLTREIATRLSQVLEQQMGQIRAVIAIMIEQDADPGLIDAARALDAVFAGLAASAAERLVELA